MRFGVLVAVVALAGCDATLTPERGVLLGQTAGGENIYRFTVSRSNGFGVSPVSERAIAAQAAAICPAGYRYLSSFAEATQRISGIIYTDVTVTIACP